MYPIRQYEEEETESSYQESSTPTVSDTTDTDTESDTDTENDTTDSEYEYDAYSPETENIFDRIYYDDLEFLDTEKEDNHYYIGLYEYIQPELLLGMTISPNRFYKYPYNDVSHYLRAYSIIRNKNSTKNIQIMKLKIDTHTNTYTVLIKTYWIRLIQIHWKKIYKERMEFIKLRKNISNQRHFELNGRYILGNNNLPPSLYGMLSIYNKKTIEM